MEPLKSYGVGQQQQLASSIDRHLEELRINGYSIMPEILTSDELQSARERLDAVYAQQEDESGAEILHAIKEQDLIRCPLAVDEFFLELATKPRVLDIAHQAVGGN